MPRPRQGACTAPPHNPANSRAPDDVQRAGCDHLAAGLGHPQLEVVRVGRHLVGDPLRVPPGVPAEHLGLHDVGAHHVLEQARPDLDPADRHVGRDGDLDRQVGRGPTITVSTSCATKPWAVRRCPEVRPGAS